MRRQGVMCGQEMGRRNVSSGHVCAVRNVSSQCVVSVTAKSDTQDAGALKIYISMYIHICRCTMKHHHTLCTCAMALNTIGESGESTTTYIDTSQPLDFQVKISKKREFVLRIPF